MIIIAVSELESLRHLRRIAMNRTGVVSFSSPVSFFRKPDDDESSTRHLGMRWDGVWMEGRKAGSKREEVMFQTRQYEKLVIHL